jgi:hypothetical protein
MDNKSLIFGYDVITYNGEQPNCLHPKFLNTIYTASDFEYSYSLEFYTKKWNTHWALYISSMYNDCVEKKSIYQIINDRRKGLNYEWFYLIEPFASLENFFGNGPFYNDFLLNNIPKPTLNEIARGNGKILINYVCDGGVGLTTQNFEKLIKFTRDNGIKDEKVFLVFSDFKLKENLQKMGVNYNVADYSYNMIIKSQEIYNTITNPNFSYWGEDSFEPQFGKVRKRKNSATTSQEFLESIGKEKKDFLMLTRRMKLHRILLLSHLHKLGLENSLVSWDNNMVGELNRDEFLKYDNNEELLKLITETSSILDIDDLQKISGMGFENKDIYLNSYLSIVTESVFYQQDNTFPAGYLSEKIWKPIGHCQPFILAAAPLSLKHIRERFGYKTFHPYIDESYDLEPDESKRLEMIKLEITKFSKKSKEEKDQFLNDVKDICIHNQNLFLDYGKNSYRGIANQSEMKLIIQFLLTGKFEKYVKSLI